MRPRNSVQRSRNRCGAWMPASLALLIFLPAVTAAEEAPSLDGLAWLAGCWAGHDGGKLTEECWLAPRAGIMPGLNRTVRDDGRGAFEFLRISQQDDGIFYHASPGGRPPTPFRLVELGEGRAVFENPEHDFPQRIIYRLDGNGVLHARIEGEVDGETQGGDWKMLPSEVPTTP